MLLYLRMLIYVLAVPVAAYLGGTYDAATAQLCINLDTAIDMIGGFVVVVVTFLSSRVAKARGGAT